MTTIINLLSRRSWKRYHLLDFLQHQLPSFKAVISSFSFVTRCPWSVPSSAVTIFASRPVLDHGSLPFPCDIFDLVSLICFLCSFSHCIVIDISYSVVPWISRLCCPFSSWLLSLILIFLRWQTALYAKIQLPLFPVLPMPVWHGSTHEWPSSL